MYATSHLCNWLKLSYHTVVSYVRSRAEPVRFNNVTQRQIMFITAHSEQCPWSTDPRSAPPLQILPDSIRTQEMWAAGWTRWSSSQNRYRWRHSPSQPSWLRDRLVRSNADAARRVRRGPLGRRCRSHGPARPAAAAAAMGLRSHPGFPAVQLRLTYEPYLSLWM